MAEEIRCSIARALGEVGERWSLLIVREALMGSTRFDEFHQRLGVARNILTARLASLVAHGVMTRTPAPENARVHHYRLTDKGREMLPVLAALMHWGDRWLHADIGAPIVLVERRTGKAVRKVVVSSERGQELAATDVDLTPGPGATMAMRRRLSGD